MNAHFTCGRHEESTDPLGYGTVEGLEVTFRLAGRSRTSKFLSRVAPSCRGHLLARLTLVFERTSLHALFDYCEDEAWYRADWQRDPGHRDH